MQPTGVLETPKATNPLKDLLNFGQSVWLDYIRRNLITSGELKRLVDEDGLRGMTSNPSIFEKAIAASTDYADLLKSLKSKTDLDAKGRFEILAVRDIQDAADILRPVYDSSKRRDGYVSLEVSPYLGRDTQGTIAEARRLWKEVNRENVMIKVPGTVEGIPAFQQLIGESININVTLLFSQEVYKKVAEAYIAGLEQAASRGADISRIASVASFFVSRIDNSVDAAVEARLKVSKDKSEQEQLKSVLGKVAIANAKLAYEIYLKILSGDRWQKLASKGAQTQRLLWASTSTKNPKYSDVLYVEELIGRDTVNTIPPATFDAFRDHGHPRASLTENVEAARNTMQTLAKLGISIEEITDKLTDDGVKQFEDAFDKLLAAVEKSSKSEITPKIGHQTYKLSEPLAKQFELNLADWRAAGKVRRLWQRDASLWTGIDEANWLGWLGIVEEQIGQTAVLQKLGEEVKREGFTDILLLGMGGSSLCPEVLDKTFGRIEGFPKLHVLDSTDPAQIKAFEEKIDLALTLFVVSSKSGTTLEPNIFKQYFFERAKQVLGAEKAGRHFIAITDPGSKLEQVAQSDQFRHIFHGVPSIGGRYSALSNFGMVPAAIMGLNVSEFLERAHEMVEACTSSVPVEENPGVVLGVILGTAAKNGRDKVTIITSTGISDLGAWLEQLLAESTGKQGKGIVPVDHEEIGSPDVYGNDRVFIYLRLNAEADAALESKVSALEKAGQPVVHISLGDVYDLGQEFFRWEIATAVAGSIIGINAFNQPDVEASKNVTRSLTAEYEKAGSLPAETPILEDDEIRLFTDKRNADELAKTAKGKLLTEYLRSHLNRIAAGDYFALLAYIQMNSEHEGLLEKLRQSLRDKKHVATCLEFGPRFLHSTGQAYKGGPNSGVFLQITCDDAADLPVPNQRYTFGVVKAAQARGDFQVLAERGRRALRIHLGKDLKSGMNKLKTAFNEALK
ncbi:MAG: bifunctional transaldolase/phosoglucose isomerase [Terriglobales bacterium]